MITPVKRIFMLLTILGFLVISVPCFAQIKTNELIELCKATISRPSNIQTSYERQQWVQDVQQGMCQITFNSTNSFRQAASSLGIDIPIASALFGLNTSGNWNDQDVKQAFHNICENHAISGASDQIEFFQSIEISNAMISAYEMCVANLPVIAKALSPSGLVIQINMSGEEEFTIIGRIFNTQPIGEIKSITGVKSCYIEGKQYAAHGSPINFEPRINHFVATCTRASPESQSIAISTNDGPSNIVSIPNQITEDSKISDISSRINAISRRVGSISERIRKENETINQNKETISRIDGTLSGVDNEIDKTISALQGSWLFGGFFSKADINGADSRENPVSGGFTCPTNFAPHEVGRVLAGDKPFGGVNQYVCIKPFPDLGSP